MAGVPTEDSLLRSFGFSGFQIFQPYVFQNGLEQTMHGNNEMVVIKNSDFTTDFLNGMGPGCLGVVEYPGNYKMCVA